MKYLTFLPLFILISCGTPEGMVECSVCDEDYSKKSAECVHCGEPNAEFVKKMKTQLELNKIRGEIDALNRIAESPNLEINVERDANGDWVRKK